MFELAFAYGRESVSVSKVAQLENISPKFLSQIIIPLKSAGLISSERGPHGGYILTRAPAKITVFDIYSTLEGEADVTECLSSEDACNRTGICVAKEVWSKLQDKIVQTLKSVNLADLVAEAEKIQGKQSPVYQI